MSFEYPNLKTHVRKYGKIARILVAQVNGSAPREVGTSMLVWEKGQSGTIGGGALEYQAISEARNLMQHCGKTLITYPLGPRLGQCCGGSVSLFTEVYTLENLPPEECLYIVRPVDLRKEEKMPLSVVRFLEKAKKKGFEIEVTFLDGWIVETTKNKKKSVEIWVWGAGHVGRATIGIFSGIPNLRLRWVDTAQNRFPKKVPENVMVLVSPIPNRLVQYASKSAEHLIMTYSHELDLELCHSLIKHGFFWAGLIGSGTKWSRFKKRLMSLGHNTQQIERIVCPIGNPKFGKHPTLISVGIASEMLHRHQTEFPLERK